jgi:hypothetical protein
MASEPLHQPVISDVYTIALDPVSLFDHIPQVNADLVLYPPIFGRLNLDGFVKSQISRFIWIPAKAGIQTALRLFTNSSTLRSCSSFCVATAHCTESPTLAAWPTGYPRRIRYAAAVLMDPLRHDFFLLSQSPDRCSLVFIHQTAITGHIGTGDCCQFPFGFVLCMIQLLGQKVWQIQDKRDQSEKKLSWRSEVKTA